MASQFYDLRVAAIKQETKDSVTVSFDIPEEIASVFRYTQGQYITIKANLEGEELRRSYSICTAPYENKITVGIKKVQQGAFSTYANEVLKVNDVLKVMPPAGNFFTELNSEHQNNYLAVACGSGITPILSIIKETLHKEPKSSFTLLYSNRNRSSIMFFEELEAIKNTYVTRFNLIHLLSRERTEIPLHYGRINESKLQELEQLIHFRSMDQVFICGPKEMIFTTKAFLENKGVDSKKIHFELFAGSPLKKQTIATAVNNDSSPQCTVALQVDGRTIEFPMPFDGDSILDSALQQGADLPFACKGGVCCTCKAKLIEGNIKMEVNYALEPEEVEQGYILTCQSRPTTHKVVIDFDIK